MATKRQNAPPVRMADPMPAALPLGPYLRKLRKARAMTIRELANAMGATPRRIANIELELRIVDPHLSSVIRAAHAMDMKPGEFLDGLIKFGETYKPPKKKAKTEAA